MTTNHDDNDAFAPMPGNDPLDGLLREWHAENATRAATQRDKLLNAIAARNAGDASAGNTLTPALSLKGDGAKSRLREQSMGDSAHFTLTPTLRASSSGALSLKGEGARTVIRRSVFARFSPAAAAVLLFAATIGLLFNTAGRRADVRADQIMAPNGGRLDAVNARGELIGPCPLKHTDVNVSVSGSFARVTLQQRYGNPYSDKIEAVYTFPMSHRAAVDRMTMTIGERVVVGEVKEREAARATYEAARASGHTAALLEQERPNIFTQSVANIEPGVEIVVEISYVELLEARDGLFGFVFPMVVAPRYIPGGIDPGKSVPAGLTAREGLNLLAPGTLAITANGDTSQNGTLTADVIHELVREALPIEPPPAEYWASHYPSTGQPAVWHQFEAGYLDGQREPGVLYTDGMGQVNGRWFYIDAGSVAASKPGTGFAPNTAAVPDASRITPQPVKPPTRAGHDISITVNIDTGGPGILDLASELHTIRQNYGAMRTDGTPSQIALALNEGATIPNQDFVLHWRQTADTITEQVFTHAGPRGGFLTLILNSPARVENNQAVPRELVFVLDTSGSMQGFPIEKAKEVMSKAIAALRPQDTFNLITFAGDTRILWDRPQAATSDKLAEAQQFLNGQQGGGGTEMMAAINAALEVKPETRQIAPGDPTPIRIVCFMTDGEVGNDMAIIDAVKKNASTTRVFSFGIGNSVNRYLLDGIARAGRGAAEYVLLSEGADAKVAAFSQRIQSPVLTDVRMDFSEGLEIDDGVSSGVDSMVEAGNASSPTEGGRYGMLLPDLYDVAPVIVHARFTKPGKGSVTLRGNAGDGPYEKTIELDLPEAQPGHDVIATLWAREKVEQLMNRDLAAAQAGTFPDALKKQVIDLGETFQIMTQFTSFVAVENLRVTVGGEPRLVPVPIELPEGQSWEGTMGEKLSEWADQMAEAEEALISWHKDVLYPKNWAEITCRKHSAAEADENTANEAIASKLQQTAPEINLDGIPIEQAIDYLRDLTGVNIVVNWTTLETAAIEKNKEVTLHIAGGTVPIKTVLSLLLDEVGGGETDLASEIGDGVLQISTKENLSNRTTIQTYNVQDLIGLVSEIKSNADDVSNIKNQVAQEHDLLWQQAEKTYLAVEEKIKKAVIEHNYKEARKLMELTRQTIEDNREYAASTSRYQQFRDHAVSLQSYIDDEEKAQDEAGTYADSTEIAARETERLASLDESKSKQIDQLLGHATELRKEHRYDDAVEVLRQTLAIDPANQTAATMKETLEDISAHARERDAKSAQTSASQDLLVEADEALIPWHKDVLYPKNWAEITAKREIAGESAANATHTHREGDQKLYFEGRRDMIVHGLEKQQFSLPESRVAGAQQPPKPTGGPETTYWFDVRPAAEQPPVAAGFAFSANPPPGMPPPMDSTVVVMNQFGVAAEQQLQVAGMMAGKPVLGQERAGYIVAGRHVVTPTDPNAPVVLGVPVTSVGQAGTIPSASARARESLGRNHVYFRHAEGAATGSTDVLSSVGVDATITPATSGGTGGASQIREALGLLENPPPSQKTSKGLADKTTELHDAPSYDRFTSTPGATGGSSASASAKVPSELQSGFNTDGGTHGGLPTHANTASTQLLIDQLLVRAAVAARAGQLEMSMAVVDAILKYAPAPAPSEAKGNPGGTATGRSDGGLAVARAMREVLTNGVLTNEAVAARVCALAANAAKRLAETAETAKLLAKRLDERLLRLALGDVSAIRPARGNGGQPALAGPPAGGPVAPGVTVGLDITDDGVLVSVLIDAFGGGTQAALTKAGLKVESTSKPTKVVIGRIVPTRLADLATCKHVRRVEAVKKR